MSSSLQTDTHWSLSHLTSTPQFVAHDTRDCRRYIQSKMRDHQFSPCGRSSALHFAHSEIRLRSITIDLVYLDHGDDFCISKEVESSAYTVQMPILGDCDVQMGRRTLPLSPGQALIVNPRQLVRKHWSGVLLQLMLRIDRASFDGVLRDDLRTESAAHLEFDVEPISGGLGQVLPMLVEAVWRDFHAQRVFQHPRVVSHLERTLLLSVLGGAPHSLGDRFDRVTAAAPCYVKRAEEFIYKYAGSDIRIADLVAASGVSVRSLFGGFRRWRGVTPMSYLRRVRLDLARRELQRIAREGGSITEVAGNSGYEHLSRFSKDYRTRFGETPSETLRKIRIA